MNPIGYLIHGPFHCLACALLNGERLPAHAVPVLRENIGAYSQTCSVCKEVVIDGAKRADGTPLNLFQEGV